MQGDKIIDVHKDDFYLIKDSTFNAEKFIGKVNSLKPNGIAILNIYIFPEDTKNGRQTHNSFLEIFLTEKEIAYQFEGEETQVSVTNLENFIRRKFILKENLSNRQLYFQRQKYFENGEFEPPLEKICYCHQYFNPDFTFKICSCGKYFHQLCFMRNETNKCWNEKCNVDCSIFFTKEEMNDKKKKNNQSQIQTSISLNPNKHSVVLNEDYFGKGNYNKEDNKNNLITLEEIAQFDTSELFKKGKKKNTNPVADKTIIQNRNNIEEKEVKIKTEKFINLGIKTEKGVVSPAKQPRIFDTTIYEKKPGGGYQVQAQIKSEINIIEDTKKKTESDREKARKIIYDNLLNGVKYLQKHPEILENFGKENPNLTSQISLIKENNISVINTHYKELANSIEKNLFESCEQKTQGSYFLPFLREFALLIKESRKILIRVILGEITSEEISKYRGDDFLPEEKKKEKEELKNKEIEKMKFKGPMKILAISNKGRMLTEIQETIDVNRNTYGFDTQLRTDGNSLHLSEYYEKVKLMKEKYPNMAENDIKFLVEAKEPGGDEIQSRLNSIIQETFNLEEQKELFTMRKRFLQRKAERFFKKKNEKTEINLMDDKVQDYIKSISFDIKAY